GQYLSSIDGCSKSTPGQIIPQDCIEAVQGIAVDAKGAVYTSSLYSQGAIKKFVPGIVGYTQKNINGFNDFYSQGISAMKTFNGYLYAAGANWERGSSIWRSLDGKNWVNTNSGGFGRGKDTPVVSGFTVFGGQLYASTATWTEIDVPGQIWRTSNGINWEEVVPDAFGVSGSGVSVAIHVVYNGYLYATVEKRYGDRVGAVMYRSLTGNSGSWLLGDTGNDNNNSYKIYSMVVYNGHLYDGADNDVDGMEIWSSPSGDSGTWEKDQTGGFGDPLNTDTGSMAVYNHTLYVGTYYAGSSGGQLWKFDGVSWSSVNTDGFGNSNNYWMRTVYSLDGYLYVITANRNEGQQIWRTSDGVKFSILNQNGLGSSGNLMVQSNVGLEVYKNNLFIGTWNKNFGGQVWGMNSAKFKKPSLTSILPLSVSAGSPSFLITITGTNFMNGSVIYFGKVPLTTTQVNLTTLEATVPAALLASPNKKLAIKVVNPKPGGGTSKVKNFIITP
ncbi:MAG: IPT/TIG domain-containing protein, partial [Leptolinea sp.]